MKATLTYSKPDQVLVDRLCQALSCHPVLAALLASRGIETTAQASFFLAPDLKTLSDPFSLKDMDKGVARILTAIENKEKILIFGDFDADGVTATALVYDFLDHCEANVSWYIPHRVKEGYSLKPEHIDMAVDNDIDLIVTVDCGVGGHEAVSLAQKEDIDVVITDHHEPESFLPEACAVIDPKREDCTAGLDYLAGVGVAFFLVMALRKSLRDNHFFNTIEEPNLLDYLDLFVIGTIGDMVSLVKENRVLCLAGFERIRLGKRLGLKSLAEKCRVDITRLDSDDISFKIVPRINAAGRISHARICVSQLTDNDPVNTQQTAELLDQLNTRRQKIEQEIVRDIESRLSQDPSLLTRRLIFLWDPGWDPTVLGIAASRLSRKYHVPVILLSAQEKTAVGSGRSINRINIHSALKQHSPLIAQFGGHAMAAGLTVRLEHLETLGNELNQYLAGRYSDEDYRKSLTIDAVLDLNDITYDLAKQIDRMRPFGTSNPEPIFMCRDIQVVSSFLMGSSHRKMILQKASGLNSHVVQAFHFNIADTDNLPDYYDQILFRLKINKFKNAAAQMVIEEA